MFFRRKDRPEDQPAGAPDLESAPDAGPPAPDPAAEALALALKRALADADNIRRRAALESDRARLAEREALLRAFLDVLDNFDRALLAIDADPAGERWRASIHGLRDQMAATLARFDAREVVALGVAFDPTVHEAIGLVEPTDACPPGTVATVVSGGWVLGDGAGGSRLLRPAQVLVATEPGDESVEE